MPTTKQLCKGYELRRIVFKVVDSNKPLFHYIGEAKMMALQARVKRMKKLKQPVDIMDLMTWSRKQLRGY